MRMGEGGGGEEREEERRVRGAPASLVPGAGHPPGRRGGAIPGRPWVGRGWREGGSAMIIVIIIRFEPLR